MAWVSPPAFSDSTVLSAAQINILSQDIEFLYGTTQGINTPFNSMVVQQLALDATNHGWWIRHQHRYFHYKIRLTNDVCNTLALYFNGSTVINDTSVRTASYTWSGYYDLNSLSLTTGTWYKIHFVTTLPTYTFLKMSIDYLLESDNTSI